MDEATTGRVPAVPDCPIDSERIHRVTDRSTAVDGIRARFVERPNRFLVRARLDSGEMIEAHLPNTGRLEHLLDVERPLVLRRAANPARKTAYTATRAWDGGWVGLEASKTPDLLIGWLATGNELPGFGPTTAIHKEVPLGAHRLDLRVDLEDGGGVWVEVKSGGRVVDGTGLLSGTPSARAAAHLQALADLASAGESTAVAFVIQRPDVRELLVGGDADAGWIEAVVGARRSGVTVLAFGCAVTATNVAVDRLVPVRWKDRSRAIG